MTTTETRTIGDERTRGSSDRDAKVARDNGREENAGGGGEWWDNQGQGLGDRVEGMMNTNELFF